MRLPKNLANNPEFQIDVFKFICDKELQNTSASRHLQVICNVLSQIIYTGFVIYFVTGSSLGGGVSSSGGRVPDVGLVLREDMGMGLREREPQKNSSCVGVCLIKSLMLVSFLEA